MAATLVHEDTNSAFAGDVDEIILTRAAAYDAAAVYVVFVNNGTDSAGPVPEDDGGGTWVEVFSEVFSAAMHSVFYREAGGSSFDEVAVTYPDLVYIPQAILAKIVPTSGYTIDEGNISAFYNETFTSGAGEDPRQMDSSGATSGNLMTASVGWWQASVTLTPDAEWTFVDDVNDGDRFLAVQETDAPESTVDFDVSGLGGTGYGVCIEWPEVSALSREQEGFRFRDDDDDEADASALASQDVDISRGKEVNTRLRMLTNYTGDPPSEALKVQYRRVGDAESEWEDIS